MFIRMLACMYVCVYIRQDRMHHTFLDGYCSTVQGLLDWFEVDLGFTELFLMHMMACMFVCVYIRHERIHHTPTCILDFVGLSYTHTHTHILRWIYTTCKHTCVYAYTHVKHACVLACKLTRRTSHQHVQNYFCLIQANIHTRKHIHIRTPCIHACLSNIQTCKSFKHSNVHVRHTFMQTSTET